MRRKSTKLRTMNLVAVIFFMIAVVFFLVNEKYPLLRAQQGDGTFRVVSVHDGDTVSLLINNKQQKVRLIGIDAPEIGQKLWGDEAKRHLESLIGSSSQEVKIEYDVEKNDKHGRVLAYLWTPENVLINLMMIKSGYAVLYSVPPNVKYADEFRKAQEEARNLKLGIWSENGLRKMPRDYRKENPRL